MADCLHGATEHNKDCPGVVEDPEHTLLSEVCLICGALILDVRAPRDIASTN
jgi:hypothetical protein